MICMMSMIFLLKMKKMKMKKMTSRLLLRSQTERRLDVKVKDDDYDDGYDDDFNDDYDAFDEEYADYDFDDDYDDDYDDEYDAPTGNTRNLGRSAKKSKGRKSDDYDVDFIDL